MLNYGNKYINSSKVRKQESLFVQSHSRIFFFQNFHCLKNDHVILKELSSWKTLKSKVNCSYITLKKYVIHPTTWKFKVFHQHWIDLLHQFVVEPCGPMKNFRSFKSIIHFISTLREHFYCCTLIIDDNLWMAHWK